MADQYSEAYLAESRVPLILGIVWTTTIVPTLLVILRLYVRINMRRAFGVDDAFAVAATMLLIADSAVVTSSCALGMGRHLVWVYSVNPDNFTQILGRFGATTPLGYISAALAKAGIAITLLRLTKGASHVWLRYVLWFLISSVSFVYALGVILFFCNCKDVRHLFNYNIPPECWPAYVNLNYSLFTGAYTAAADFITAAIPWLFIWKLNMKRKERLAIALAMSLGIFAGVAAIMKTINLTVQSDADTTWAFAPLLWWYAAETGLAIVAGTIPTLRPLIQQIRAKTTAWHTGVGDSSNNSSSRPKYPTLVTFGGSELPSDATADAFNKTIGVSAKSVGADSASSDQDVPLTNLRAGAKGDIEADAGSEERILGRDPEAVMPGIRAETEITRTTTTNNNKSKVLGVNARVWSPSS